MIATVKNFPADDPCSERSNLIKSNEKEENE